MYYIYYCEVFMEPDGITASFFFALHMDDKLEPHVKETYNQHGVLSKG